MKDKSMFYSKMCESKQFLIAAILAVSFSISARATDSSCSAVFSGTQLDLSAFPALSALKNHLETEQQGDLRHALLMYPEGPVLKIGLLKRSQKKFMVLAHRAIEEGSLKKIDGGNVVGPKVFPSILSLANAAIMSKQELVIVGKLSPGYIKHTFKFQTSDQSATGALHWSAREIEAFEKAVVALEIHRCTAERCRFTYRIQNGELKVSYEMI